MFMCLLGMVVGIDDDWWNPTQKFGKWAEWKAYEVCYGAPAMEQFHVKHNKALFNMMNQFSQSSGNSHVHVVPIQQNDNAMMKMIKMMMNKMVNGDDYNRYGMDYDSVMDDDMSGFQ